MIENDLITIVDEIKKASGQKFTGKLILTLDMRGGGIGNMSLNLDRILKNNGKMRNS